MNALGRAFRESVSGLYPGYFAMVMATGVVAIQSSKLGYSAPAVVLACIACIAYVTLWFLNTLRGTWAGKRMVDDFRSFAKSAAFFTVSAGTTVLGKTFLIVLKLPLPATALWCLGWIVWIFLIYTFSLNLFTAGHKPSLSASVNGVWLILPVATQSLSILTSLLSSYIPGHSLMMLVALVMHMLGCALYLIVIAAVLYRLVFFDLEPDDLRPAYWVCMGAAAISTLAGVELCRRVDIWRMPFEPLPSLQGFTMFFWVVATAWIPLLAGLGIWRHAVRRIPLRYDPQYWSMVFPLAMYAICTGGAADIFHLPALSMISRIFLYVAGLAWIVVFIGLVKTLLSGFVAAIKNSPEKLLATGLASQRGAP